MNGCTPTRPTARRRKHPGLVCEVFMNIYSTRNFLETFTHYSTGELKNDFLRQTLLFLHDRLQRLAHVRENQKPAERTKQVKVHLRGRHVSCEPLEAKSRRGLTCRNLHEGQSRSTKESRGKTSCSASSTCPLGGDNRIGAMRFKAPVYKMVNTS